MFYSQFILAKKGPLGTIWIAAHLERKLRKNQVADTDIGVSVDSILFPEVPIALRLSSHLLLGVVRIYSRKVSYLFDDCSEALLKIKQAFRSTAVDLPPEESTAPYHSITLPETFDLDDFELPDHDIFQGNYVDQHVSTREQITLQDTMDCVVYSTSQFGLDERFGDGDTSQIGLDLDEELLLDKVAAAGHGASDADPKGSVKPMTLWEQDSIIERINETLEATTVNDSANQLERLGLNAESIEYAEAPSTPGLVQEPNLSSVQKALAGDDHLESEDHNSNELMATESKVNALSQSDFHHGDSHATDRPWPKDSNNETLERNGCYIRDADVGDFIKSMPLASDNSEGTVGQLDGSDRLENVKNVPSMLSVKSQGDKSDETAASPSSTLVTSDTQDPNNEMCPGNVSVSEGYLVDDQASVKTKIHNDAEISEVHAYKDPDDPETLRYSVCHEEMSCVGMNVLKPCSSHLSELDISYPGDDNSVAPNIQSVEVGSHSLETSKRNDTSVELQGEKCHVIGTMQSEKSQRSGASVCGDIQADNTKLDEPSHNVISGDIHLKELNNSMNSDLPAPEKLLTVPEGLLDIPIDWLLESAPGKEILEGSGGADAGNKLIYSGKKRSYTESNITVESLNSESFGVDRSKKNSEFIPDDDDLLSSILVGRKSSVLKMKPSPPAPVVASRKRARSAPQTSSLKRKVLMDETMVLHGDLIRQQLTNTEDIRRIRKKAPCTSSEILMIWIQFLEDEIFSKPIFTGMSAELTSMCCETQDLSKIMVTETDELHGSSEVAEDVECSVRPNVIEGGEERSKEPVVLTNKGETQPSESPIQAESQQVGDHHLGSFITDVQGHTNSVTYVAEDNDRGNVEVVFEATCSVVHGIETLSQTDVALAICTLQAEGKTDGADASCLAPDERIDTQPVEEDASLAHIINAKGVEDTKVVDRNVDDMAAVETEAKGRDGDLLEEGKVGLLVENGADAQTDCTALTYNMNTSEAASLENGGCNNRASANGDNSNLGVVNEDGVIVADSGCDGRDPSSNHLFGEEAVIDSKNSVELGVDMENASSYDGQSQIDLQSAMDVDITAGDYPAQQDHGKFEEVTAGNDTEFLNIDDDEVAEDYEDGDGGAEETRLLDNSGWSSRTRAVAKYLQTLFGREAVNGRKALALDHLLAGKTRKEASRMFFETLVLKTKDYIQADQPKPLDHHIILKPRAKLMKSEL